MVKINFNNQKACLIIELIKNKLFIKMFTIIIFTNFICKLFLQYFYKIIIYFFHKFSVCLSFFVLFPCLFIALTGV